MKSITFELDDYIKIDELKDVVLNYVKNNRPEKSSQTINLQECNLDKELNQKAVKELTRKKKYDCDDYNHNDKMFK